RITRTDMKTGMSWILAGLYNGRPFNSPNDLVIDARGRIYFTDPRYSGHEPIEQPVQGVYRIDPDGRVSLVAANAGKPNGIAVSPDQATLYVASIDNGSFDENLPPETPTTPGRMALLAYDLAPDGSAKFRRTVVDFSPGVGPDGISVDRDGNIYCAIPGRERPGIHVFSPSGKELAYIPTPDPPTNVKFGRGADMRTLFITARNSLYRIRVERSGYHSGFYRLSRRQIHSPRATTAASATTASALFTRVTTLRTTSRFVPSTVTEYVRSPYHSADASASGTSARTGRTPAIPANGITTPRHTGSSRLRKIPYVPWR